MATLRLRLPESLHRKLAERAKAEGISINQLVATAAAEKLSALTTESYLAERASRASRSRFESALATVPDVPPSNDDDALPVGYRKPAAKKLATKGVNVTGPRNVAVNDNARARSLTHAPQSGYWPPLRCRKLGIFRVSLGGQGR